MLFSIAPKQVAEQALRERLSLKRDSNIHNQLGKIIREEYKYEKI